MAKTLSEHRLRHIALVLVCMGCIVIPEGCRFPLSVKPAIQQSALSPVELKNYRNAVDVYTASDYKKAARQFESIREQTADPVMFRMALFGLACSRLMSADSIEEYQNALNLWDTWVKCAPLQRKSEDPLLFAPFIKEKMIFSPIARGAERTDSANAPAARLLSGSPGDMQRVKAQLEDAARSIDLRDKKIKELEKEISRLNDQINAFEKIDQKIQKKKSAIPSAD